MSNIHLKIIVGEILINQLILPAGTHCMPLRQENFTGFLSCEILDVFILERAIDLRSERLIKIFASGLLAI